VGPPLPQAPAPMTVRPAPPTHPAPPAQFASAATSPAAAPRAAAPTPVVPHPGAPIDRPRTGPMIRPPHLGGPAAAEPAAHPAYLPPAQSAIAEVALIPRRRRDDHLIEHDGPAPEPLPQADLPPGFTDPITGLPLAEAMRADIELRATDFRNFTVVVCHPMLAMTTPGGTVNASPNAPFGQEEVRIFAGVLRDTLRQRDIVGRYDDRLFLLFLPRCKVDEVLIPMRRIRANLLAAQHGAGQWVDITFGAAAGQIGESVDAPLRTAYADLLRRNAGPAWFLED